MSVYDSTYAVVEAGDATVLERVLLAIIKAHTTPETAGREAARQQAAMDALMGPASLDEKRIEEALQFMTRYRQRANCDAEIAALSLRREITANAIPTLSELAEAAAREILHCRKAEMSAMVRLLCRLYRQRAMYSAVEADLVGKALKAEAVKRICDELYEWGISTRV